MARLLLATPEGQQVVDLRPQNSLGRHPSNSIQLLDKIVSKEHCLIELRGETYVLRDLGSLNGTYINGQRVNGEQALNHGDDIALGATRARFDDESGHPVAAPPPVAAPQGGWATAGAGPISGQPATGSPLQSQQGQPGSAAGSYSYTPHSQPGQTPTVRQPGPGANPPQTPAAPGLGLQPKQTTAMRVDVSDQARSIGTQIAATQKGFLPYDQLVSNPDQLSADYERLRLSHELSREIALERDLPSMLNKILLTIFKFVRADRGVIFLKANDGQLVPGASQRRDGTNQPIPVSSTIMNHVIRERATVLTHDAAMDFAASKGKSMILNRISSAIVAPLLHNDEILGVLWLDSETLAN